MKFQKLRLVLTSLLAFSVSIGSLNAYQALAEYAEANEYRLMRVSAPTQTIPGAVYQVDITIQNVSPLQWDPQALRLGTVFPNGAPERISQWRNDTWVSPARPAISLSTKKIYPLTQTTFSFEIIAPTREGTFRELFQPVMDGGEAPHWLKGAPIEIDIVNGSQPEVVAQAYHAKEVKVYLNRQEADLIENGVVVATLTVSSGKPGYSTPKGSYTVMNHFPDAYSSEYQLWMPNWMALSHEKYGFVGYGFHGLPYWRVNPAKYVEGTVYPGGRLYTQGRLYEGYEHLGKPVSHGCVRSGIAESKILYDWAPNGTPVTIT